MTAAMLDVWLQSAHATGVLKDGDDFRTACVCGYMGLPELSEAAARQAGCEVERIQLEGRARLAAYLARQKSDESGLRRAW